MQVISRKLYNITVVALHRILPCIYLHAAQWNAQVAMGPGIATVKADVWCSGLQSTTERALLEAASPAL